MRNMFQNLWNDDDGALIAIEFLLFATILVLGLIVGFATVRDAVVTELVELSNAVLALSQGYTVSGLTGCCSEIQGSATIDTPALVPDPTCLANFIPSVIDALPCD